MSRPRTPTVTLVFPNFLTVRNWLEQAKRVARLTVEASKADDDRLRDPSCIVIPPGFVRHPKRYPGERDVSQIFYMVGHVMDVRGGFSVQKWGEDGWRKWAKRLQAGSVPALVLEDLEREFGKLADDEVAKLLAYLSRYAQTPYHRFTSPKVGECVNRPLEHRTKASGAGNSGVAMAMDMHHTEVITDAFAEGGQNMVRRLYFDLRKAGREGPIAYRNHGMFSRDRWNDTHSEAHLRVFKPAIVQLQQEGEDVFVDYEFATAGGRQLTTRDDPDAHFDTRGRRVRNRQGVLL